MPLLKQAVMLGELVTSAALFLVADASYPRSDPDLSVRGILTLLFNLR